jgi:hypothetical protein
MKIGWWPELCLPTEGGAASPKAALHDPLYVPFHIHLSNLIITQDQIQHAVKKG